MSPVVYVGYHNYRPGHLGNKVVGYDNALFDQNLMNPF